jgi:non-specific serine/threonine protein kinase
MPAASAPQFRSTGPPSRPLPLASGDKHVGRFALRQLIGRSTLTMAWQARDTRSGLTVMLMLPRSSSPSEAILVEWSDSVRRSARLDHPRLLAPIEFGQQEGRPYLACECPPGASPLAVWLAEHPLPSAVEAARWSIDLLDGLAYVHDGGLAHGDVGLHNIIVDRQGHARLWGLGVAMPDAATPSAQDEVSNLQLQRAAADRDVLAVGLLLYQWVARVPALDEPDLSLAMRRIDHEIVRLPWSLPTPVPEALRAIVNRATDRHAQRRYIGARGLQRALGGWVKAEADGKGGALALLVDKLHAVGHLPARPGLAQRVVQVTRMDTRRIDDLTEVILEDPALSFELLRAVNSAELAGHTGQVVTTVRRAVELLGTTGVRRAAGGLRAWPGPLNATAALALESGMRLALLSGHVAEILAPAGLDAEAALLIAQLQHLGRLLVLYHFADEASQIDRLMTTTPDPVEPGRMTPGLTETAAAMAVIGVSLDALAAAVAHHWGLDERIRELIQPLSPRVAVHSPEHVGGWLRVVASCAFETVAVSQLPATVQGRALALVAGRYARGLGTTVESLRDTLVRARQRLGGHMAVKQRSNA